MVFEWHKINSIEDLPVESGEYLVTIKERYSERFDPEFTYHVDIATFVGRENEGMGYLDNFWDTSNDWIEGQQYLKVTHWAETPSPAKD